MSGLGLSVDYLVAWPYDWGGCGCEHDWPWGYVGFPRMSVEILKAAQSSWGHHHAEAVVSTWHFQMSKADEYGGLDSWLRQNSGNFTHAMSAVPGGFDWLAKHNKSGTDGVGGLPTLDFPEISMFGRCPWGGTGANPIPNQMQLDWNTHGHLISGGMPY